MKLVATLFALLAAAAAVPVTQDAGPAPKAPAAADPMPGLFMNLMKDIMAPAAQGGASADPVIKDVMGLITNLASADGHASGGQSHGIMDDPMLKMMTTLAQTAMSQQGGADGADGADPMVKMATAGMQAFMQTMNGDTPAHDAEEQPAGGKPAGAHAAASEDPLQPMMQLMMKGMAALASDKKGDPVGAVMNVVLDDPVMAKNPVIRSVKAAVEDKSGDPMNAMLDSLMGDKQMQQDPYVLPILRIAKNVVTNMPKDGDSADPLAAVLNALAGPPKSPRAPKALVSPDVAPQQ